MNSILEENYISGLNTGKTITVFYTPENCPPSSLKMRPVFFYGVVVGGPLFASSILARWSHTEYTHFKCYPTLTRLVQHIKM